MLPMSTVPPSLAVVVETLRCCFTMPSFTTFCALVIGLVGQVGPGTVTGTPAGLGCRTAGRTTGRTRFSPGRAGVLMSWA